MAKTPKQVILDVLHDASDALTARQLAAMCGRSKTTPFLRHLRALVEAGLVTEIKPDASAGGRPAYLYRINKATQKGDLRKLWHTWCQVNFALDYVLWLEGVASGEIDPQSRG